MREQGVRTIAQASCLTNFDFRKYVCLKSRQFFKQHDCTLAYTQPLQTACTVSVYAPWVVKGMAHSGKGSVTRHFDACIALVVRGPP
eukprot:753883-Pleurochrysis_carterae.AAC.1